MSIFTIFEPACNHFSHSPFQTDKSDERSFYLLQVKDKGQQFGVGGKLALFVEG